MNKEQGLWVLRKLDHLGIIHLLYASIGPCHRCGFRADLRMGACYECSSMVQGKNHEDGLHELWDRTNPTNRWLVSMKS